MSLRSMRLLFGVLASALLLSPLVTAAPAARAQGACTAETEPNDAPEAAPTMSGAMCVSGTLPKDDQDLVLWELTEQDAASLWTFEVTGIRGTLTALKVVPITSAPGATPVETGGQLLEVSSTPADSGPIALSDLHLPAGRYVLGISRSTLVDGSEPFYQDYTFSIRPGTPTPPSGDREPNDSRDSASPADGAFSISGDLAGSGDYLLWTVPESSPGLVWTLRARGVVGSPISLTLERQDGSRLAGTSSDPVGLLTLPGLRLEPGAYRLFLTASGESYPYTLDASTGELAGDPEPNDDPTLALALPDDGTSFHGRLGAEGDRDFYRLTIDASTADLLRDVTLISPTQVHRRVCLQTTESVELQCREADGGLSMAGLLLPEGDYLLVVVGDADIEGSDGYILRVERTTAPARDYETEPNATPQMASAFDPAVVIRGRGAPDDLDVFRMSTTGEPQLWEVEATGVGIRRLAWIKADTSVLGEGEVATGGGSALLTDLYLIPGEHWLRLDADGDYQLRATPLGPPDPNAEREPNSDSTLAEPYRLGRERIVGRLATGTDVDVFRFSLAGTERLTLTVQPPADGAIALDVTSGRQAIGSVRSPGAGMPIARELLLPPGDYEVRLRPETSSRGRYAFSIERGDPFRALDDEEPNDDPAHAGPVPATLAIEGAGIYGGEQDWYLLPPVAEGTPISVRFEGSVSSAVISDGVAELPGTFDVSTGILVTEPVVGPGPRYLRIGADGPYTARILAEGLVPVDPPAPLPVRLELTASALEVAAWWGFGQRVEAVLSISNDGSTEQTLELDALTSHVAWTATPESQRVTVAAGQSIEVPVTVHVGADAWADDPVRVTLRARDAGGGYQTAFVVVTPRRTADPVAPEPWWPVPEALLGGLDVASLALGATPIASVDPEGEAELHDGLTHSDMGLVTDASALPLTLTVDLAGDAPVPVAGIILNPQAGDGYAGDVPRAFELLLSTDGVTYAPALAGEMSTLTADQPFLLQHPVDATYAQLRIDSLHGGGLGKVNLGEWKVIAVPGVRVSVAALDLGEPLRGGHVAWMEPQPDYPDVPQALLTEDPMPATLRLDARTQVAWAVGFRDDRAALITRLEWVDPSPSDPSQRFKQVDVAVSLDGPVGPWRNVGTWQLERGADGSVASFSFAEPTWARFVRFSGTSPKKQASSFELPVTLRVIERETDADYRSVLGQWGAASPEGPYEWLSPPDLSLPASGPDGNDSPETADPLPPSVATAGRVDAEVDEDWYTISVPAGHNSLAIEVTGRPIVTVALTLTDTEGLRVPMLFSAGERPGSVVYAAEVTPGATYRLMVAQPPSSIVFTYDTSASIWNYFPYVSEGLRAFSADVTPGEEAVKIIPFEERPLLEDWSDQPYQLQDAVERYLNAGSSSSAEAALIAASTELSAREGARAILVVTDAETSSWDRSAELWRVLSSVRPLIFAVHIGATSEPFLSGTYMQDWSRVAGGFYQYTRSHGEMDRAFDRLATWLRRPAEYRLTMETSFREIPPPSTKPGSLVVRSPADAGPAGGPGSALTLGPDVGVEIILDTSGSMRKSIRGRPRIDIAKAVLADLVSERLPAGTPVAIRVLGDRDDVCGTRLLVPLGPLDRATVIERMDPLTVDQEADTPLAAALRAVPGDLAGSTGTRIVLLITDSEEVWPHPDLCGVDPAAAIRDLRREGIDARLNIVGLQVDARKAKAQLRRWARLGNGSYFEARDAEQLGRSIRAAVSAPFRVLDASGNEVASGTVDGSAVPLPPGTYSVVVLTDPVARFDGVRLEPGGALSLTLPVPQEPTPDEPAPGSLTPAP